MRWFRRRGRGRSAQEMRVLADCPAGSRVVITGTAALQTIELGLYKGIEIDVLCNEPSDRMLAVQASGTRLSLPRDWAENIFVESLCQRSRADASPPHLLRAIRQYIRENGIVDTTALATHFEMQVDAMAGILAFLAARNMVQKHMSGCKAGCAGCRGCGMAASPAVPSWSVGHAACRDGNAKG